MDRHKQMSILPPVRLYKEDLIQLEKILTKYVDCSGCDLSITPISHGHKISGTPFHSFDTLFKQENLPHNVDQIIIDARETSPDKELVRDAQVSLNRTISYLRVLNPTSEEWVAKAFSDINDYLTSKKVWYSFLAKAIPPIFNTSAVFAFMLTALAILTGKFTALVFPIILIVCAGVLLVLNLTGKVYSVARINLYSASEETRPDYEKFVIWVYLAIMILCILGSVAMVWNILTGAN